MREGQEVLGHVAKGVAAKVAAMGLKFGLHRIQVTAVTRGGKVTLNSGSLPIALKCSVIPGGICTDFPAAASVALPQQPTYPLSKIKIPEKLPGGTHNIVASRTSELLV